MKQTNKPAELSAAIEIAKMAGELTLEWYGTSKLEVSNKGDGSPVTAADKAAEELARERLALSFPDDGIVGEEFGQNSGASKYTWTIDPIDGTRSFVCGVPTYSTLLARGNLETNEWDLGVIYIPVLDELLYAYKGMGCWYELGARNINYDKAATPQKVEVSKTTELKNAKVVASGADYVPTEIIQKAETFRTWGDGYGYLLLATGQVDLMMDVELFIWDVAPMQTIVPEAGGEILKWSGAPEDFSNKSVSSSKALLPDLGKYLELEKFKKLEKT